MDYGTEADALSDWDDGDDWDYDEDDWEDSHQDNSHIVIRVSRDQGGDREQPDRWRCLATGCNPALDEESAAQHRADTGHRVAKWPVRSAEGKRRAAERNRTGYYDRYNVGAKSARARGIRR